MRLLVLLALVVIYVEAHSGKYWMPKVFVIKSKKPIYNNYKITKGYKGGIEGYSKFGKTNYVSNTGSMNYVELGGSDSGVYTPVSTNYAVSDNYAAMRAQGARVESTRSAPGSRPVVMGTSIARGFEVLPAGGSNLGSAQTVEVFDDSEINGAIPAAAPAGGPIVGNRVDSGFVMLEPTASNSIGNSDVGSVEVLGSASGSVSQDSSKYQVVGSASYESEIPSDEYVGYQQGSTDNSMYVNGVLNQYSSSEGVYKPGTARKYIIRRYFRVPNKFYSHAQIKNKRY